MNQTSVSPHLKQKFVKIPESLTLLDPQRQRNLGKYKDLDLTIRIKSAASF